MNIEWLFHPESAGLFLNEALGRHAMHVHGAAGKFDGLMSWSKVNRLLTYGGLAYPRLRLIAGSQAIAPEEYSKRGRGGYCRLLVAEMSRLLRGGALVAIDAVDLLDEHVRDLCNVFEQALGMPVEAELYGSFQEHIPRPYLWDDHETLLLQIDGRKHWSLYQPTAFYPTAAMEPAYPEGPPRWSGALESGDLLYIPRGWWHRDCGMGESALYLAISFTVPRGSDVVSRLAELFRRKEVASIDIPKFRSADYQSRYLTTLQQELTNVIAQPGIFAGLLSDIQAACEPLIDFNLPLSVQSNPIPPPAEYQLCLLTRFSKLNSFTRHRTDGSVDLLHNGRAIRFDGQIIGILDRLSRSPAPTLGDLLAEREDSLARDRVMGYVSELITAGLLSARPPADAVSASGVPGSI